ncbi:MAG TPA: LysR family transcriptional regulator [Clostridia bacterium]|nr:LysR family transcriptional regulator [Clostridia bacterium]
MKVRYKVWLDNDGKAFGDGPYEMLEKVERLGSLRRAADEMGMSYAQAWNLLKTLEKRLGFELMVRKAGGTAGGGSTITPEGKKLMEKYIAFRKEAGDSIERLYKKYFND